jgi:hypothetical protein
MCKRFYFLLATSVLLIASPGAFGTSVLYPCSPLTLTTDSDYLASCPKFTALPPSTVTAIRLYLTADFSGGIPDSNGSIEIAVYFLPQTTHLSTWSGTMGTSCFLTNGGSGLNAVTNNCGFYSGNPNAPGTRFLIAYDHLVTLAATGFEVLSLRGYFSGNASTVFAQDFVEYIYTPEPPIFVIFGSALIVLGWLVRRHSRAPARQSS